MSVKYGLISQIYFMYSENIESAIKVIQVGDYIEIKCNEKMLLLFVFVSPCRHRGGDYCHYPFLFGCICHVSYSSLTSASLSISLAKMP